MAIAGVSAFLYYMYHRAKIVITGLNETTNTVNYKVTIGFRTIKGSLSNLKPQTTQIKCYGKVFTATNENVKGGHFSITNDKGDILAEKMVNFNSAPILDPSTQFSETNLSA